MKTCRQLGRWSAALTRRIHRAGMFALGLSLLPVAMLAQVNYTPYIFNTTGRASMGNEDGAGIHARFALPHDVAVDRAGNVYVADTDNHTIRKITLDGTVTTLAGLAGVAGSADGVGSAARLAAPEGIAVDAFGTTYVADTGNHTIRKITPSGLVTTLAGLAGTSGSVDGIGSRARFESPGGVAVDSAGNVFVAEIYGYNLRKVTPGGAVTTMTGLTGALDDTSFLCPRGLAVDAADNLYVADTLHYRIAKITPAGSVTSLRLADGTVAPFERPQKVAVDRAGNVYVPDSANRELLRLTPSGDLTTFATLPVALPPTDGTMPYPDGVAVDALGNVVVADTGNSTILRVTPDGTMGTLAGVGPAFGSSDAYIREGLVVGDYSIPVARFFYPAGLSADRSGNYTWVADSANHTIRSIWRGDGSVGTLAGMAGVSGSVDGVYSAARFKNPTAVATGPDGTIYVADTGNSTVRKIAGREVTTLAGLAGCAGNVDGTGSAARFWVPQSLAVDGGGNVYVADICLGSAIPKAIYASEIRKITPAGEVTTLARVSSFAHVTVLPPALSIAINGAGTLFAAAYDTGAIYKVAPDGTVTVFAGAEGTGGGPSVDGNGTAARFTAPAGIAVDPVGNLYVTGGNAVRMITPAGVVTTLAGVSNSVGSTDGVGSAVRFNGPTGITYNGELYVSDTDNHTIRSGSAAVGPAFTSQPLSQTVPAGVTVEFAVTLAGIPGPKMQWYHNGIAIPSAVGIKLTLSGVQTADAGEYLVTATNEAGSATSNKATLSVSSGSSGSAAAGGGGAMGAWFVAGLAALAALRRRVGRDRARIH